MPNSQNATKAFISLKKTIPINCSAVLYLTQKSDLIVTKK